VPISFRSLGGDLDQAPASAVCVKSILRIAPGKSPGVAVLGLYDGAMRKEPAKDELDHDRRMGVNSVTRLSVQRGKNFDEGEA
jgi:hypothetical protein